MWRITLRDLQWRRRRFAIATIGTSLVFAMTLVLAGFSAAFRTEADRTLSGIGADAWVVPAGAAGPFSGQTGMPSALAAEVAREPGVRAADPFVFLHQSARAPQVRDVDVIGYRIGGVGEPAVAAGRLPRASGEAAVDEALRQGVDGSFEMAGRRFTVVGTLSGMTAYGGLADVFIPIQDAQAIAFGGQPMATAVVTRGRPTTAPAGYALMDNADARADLIRPLLKAVATIDMIQFLLWLVAASIIASVVYLSAMERVRDFAVLKATGASSRALLGGLAVQSVAVSLLAAALSGVLAAGMAGFFPMRVEVPVEASLLLPAVALVVGLLASLSGARRAIAVDPALAFGGP